MERRRRSPGAGDTGTALPIPVRSMYTVYRVNRKRGESSESIRADTYGESGLLVCDFDTRRVNRDSVDYIVDESVEVLNLIVLVDDVERRTPSLGDFIDSITDTTDKAVVLKLSEPPIDVGPVAVDIRPDVRASVPPLCQLLKQESVRGELQFHRSRVCDRHICY